MDLLIEWLVLQELEFVLHLHSTSIILGWLHHTFLWGGWKEHVWGIQDALLRHLGVNFWSYSLVLILIYIIGSLFTNEPLCDVSNTLSLLLHGKKSLFYWRKIDIWLEFIQSKQLELLCDHLHFGIENGWIFTWADDLHLRDSWSYYYFYLFLIVIRH